MDILTTLCMSSYSTEAHIIFLFHFLRTASKVLRVLNKNKIIKMDAHIIFFFNFIKSSVKGCDKSKKNIIHFKKLIRLLFEEKYI